jgi:drug/metabolite transporter (DMT)-like permease
VIGFNWQSLPAGYQTGIGLGLATAVFYSGFILALRKLLVRQKELSFFYSLMLVSAVSSLWLFPTIIISGASFTIPTITSLGSLLGLAVFSQTIGWAFIANSLPKVPSSIAGLVLLLQPALAFVWDVLIFDRPASLSNWAGLCIVLAAIYLGMRPRKKAEE